MEKLKRLLQQHNFDYAALTELNKNWSKVPTNNNMWSATKDWREHRRIQASFNQHFPTPTEKLIGGTASMAFDEMVFRISEQSSDARGLGRWSIITIQGKNQLHTTIINCYCPVRNASCTGSTWSQHLVYMSQNQDSLPDQVKNPRELFGHDLATLIASYQQKQHQLLVLGDFNSQYSQLCLWMKEKGLHDLIHQRHGKSPITCKKSATDPIDCIFGSPSISCAKAGFLSFSKLVSDHRGIWIDVPKALIFGFNPPTLANPQARRLKLHDPRVTDKYLQHIKEHLSIADIHDMNALHANCSYPLTEPQKEEYKRLDHHSSQIMKDAERQCRKFKMGRVPWSPTYKKAMLTFEYWCQRHDYILGLNRNVRDLITLQKKLGIQYDNTLTLDQVKAKKYECYLHRRKMKSIAEQLSLDYRYRLAMAREESGLEQAATYLRSRNKIEAQRRTFRNIRHIEQRIKGGATTHVEITAEDGSVTELSDKDAMEAAMIRENPRKYHQCKGLNSSAFLQTTFLELFGNYGEGPATREVLEGTFDPPFEIDNDTRDFLDACKYIQGNPCQATVAARYIATRHRWKIRKEQTVSHNEHMGHYKCLMKDDTLSWFFFQRAEIPFYSGYASKRHRTCVDLMILKKARCYELSKLRTLGLLDTEFNNNNKELGYEAMKRALKLNRIATEQFSRPARFAIDQSILK